MSAVADQQKWFKLWTTAPSDDDLIALPVADRWAWAVLGCHTKTHGSRGTVSISLANVALAGQMGIDVTKLHETCARLPHVNVQKPDNGKFVVTWQNWLKYQEDSSVYERVKRLRSKKRGEEKRGDQKEPPVAPQGASRPFERNGDEVLQHHDEESAEEAAAALRGAAAEHLDVVPDELRDANTLLEFLNAKTGRTYGGLANLQLIDARLREGWSVQQCRTMTMRKVRDWRDDARMATFLRPATLFNRAKLESYMAELGYVRS